MAARFKLLNAGCFPFDVLVAAGATVPEVAAKIVRTYGVTLDDQDLRNLEDTRVAVTVELSGGQVVIRFLEDVPSLGTVTHEAFHATSRILDRCGISLAPESNEAYAYLLDHLMEQLGAFFYAPPKKKKGRK